MAAGGIGDARGIGDGARQTFNGRAFKNFSQRQIDLEFFCEARDDLRRKQRMASEFEKVFVNAEVIAPENFAPDFKYLLLSQHSGVSKLCEPSFMTAP